MFIPLTFLFLIFAALAQAIPLVKRIVVDPQITSPGASTVWTVGSKVLVTWDTSTVPSGNITGMLILGFVTPGSENLDLDNPLATNFSLISGRVQITVPAVTPKSSYIVVLFGDSGNASPQFTISGNTPPSQTQTSAAPSVPGSGSDVTTSVVSSITPGGPISPPTVLPTPPLAASSAPAPLSTPTSPAVSSSTVSSSTSASVSSASSSPPTSAANTSSATSHLRATHLSAIVGLIVSLAFCF